MKSPDIKITIVGPTNLGPYHLARYNALVSAGVNVTVVKTSVGEFYRPWHFNQQQAQFKIEEPYNNLPANMSWSKLITTTRHYLEEKRPDIVIAIGYNRRYIWAMSYVCRQIGIPTLLYLVGWEGERQRHFHIEYVKRWYCKRFFSGAMVTGSRAAAYAKVLGIPQKSIWRISNVVDNNHFASQVALDGQLAHLEAPYFLTVSRLSSEKNIHRLLKAFSLYRASGGKWHLAIAGTGPDEHKFHNSVDKTIENHVHWLGWIDYGELPALYSKASMFILPSLIEPWGLVANEAMAAGCPVLISRMCGCQPELCWRGLNGYDFDPRNTKELTQLMLHSSSSEVDLKSMSAFSKHIISLHRLETWTATVVDCLRFTKFQK